MRIAIGQDAIGRWAWMIHDGHGRLLASGDDYYVASLALEAAMDKMSELQLERDAVR